MRKIIKGDEVVVAAGKDRGRRGTVRSVVDRVGFKTLEDGTKVRFFKSNGETVS